MYVLELAIALFLLGTMPDDKRSDSDEPVFEATTDQQIASEEVILIEGNEYVLRAGMWLSKETAAC